MKRLLCSVLLLAAGCTLPPAAFVSAERAAHDAIAPEYTAYVQADPALTQEQKDRRLRTVALWLQAIQAAEQAVGK